MVEELEVIPVSSVAEATTFLGGMRVVAVSQ
jgi:hypothetical protein